MPLLIAVGLVALGIALGVGGSAVWLGVPHAKPADWLGFAGNTFGAALTILGALMAVQWQAVRESTKRRKMLTDQLDNVAKFGDLMRDAMTPAKPLQATVEGQIADPLSEWLFQVSDPLDHLAATIQKLDATLKLIAPDTASMMEAHAYMSNLMPAQIQLAETFQNIVSKPANKQFIDGYLREVERLAASARALL